MDPQTKRAAGRVGTLLKEKWRLDELVGVGGMAAVYAATHRNGKRVAVKMLHPEISLDAEVRQRFLLEGYAANAVGHRGAVQIDDDDVTDDGSAFLVMELLRGETLDQRLARKGGKLPPEEVLSLCDQVLDTLGAAHGQGIVHRDLKPENLFKTGEGTVKVLDFGIARLREMSGKVSTTQAGAVMGTPAFMAPEQAKSRWDEVDARTDLWAIGATMFYLLTGRYVHEADTVTEALALAVTRPARPITTVDASIPQAVAELVDKALAYEKAARWPDAPAMQEALRAAYQALGGGTFPLSQRLSIADGSLVELTEIPSELEEIPAELIVEAKTQTMTGPGVSTTLVRARGSAAVRRKLVVSVAAGAVALVGAIVLTRSGAHSGVVVASEPSGALSSRRSAPSAPSDDALPRQPMLPAPVVANPAVTSPSPAQLATTEARPASAAAKGPAKVAAKVAASAKPKARRTNDPFAGRF